MRVLKAAAMAFAAAILAGCAAQRPSGVQEYYGGDFAAARQIYEGNLAAEPNSRALYELRLGTLDLDGGNVAAAREHFVRASAVMEDFTASGEFKAFVGAESSKEYKGDPCEQMMALWYLGLLDYMSGDYSKALPSFRSAALADGGSTEERYRSDAASVFFMMAETYRALGDEAKARQEFDEAAGVYRFRETVDRVAAALAAARDEVAGRAENPAAADVAYGLLADGISAGATREQDPARALDAARGRADDALARAVEKRDRGVLIDQDPQEIAGYLRETYLLARQRAAGGGPLASESPLAQVVRRAGAPGNNLLLLAGIGAGPFKYRAGDYGELARIGQASYPDRYAEVYIDGRFAGRSETVEDVYYQASTRGGRAMDAILRGKAVFKGATAFGGMAALAVASTAEHRNTQRNALIAGAALLAMSVATQPQADVRSWETLPDQIQALGAPVPPGRHSVEVRYYGAGGLLPGWTQRWDNVEFLPDRQTVFYVRAGKGGAWSCGVGRVE